MNDLKKLSNAELENSMGAHVHNERMSLDHIYAHINEVYRRELHLLPEYGSMKKYLIRRWKYSESDAYRKIDGARLLKDVPALAAEIRNGNVNADLIGEVSRAVKEKERATGEKISAAAKSDLVKMISGKSVRESQRELAQALDIEVKEFETKKIQKDNSTRWNISTSEELQSRIDLCRDHASHKLQQQKLPNTLESMLKILTDYYIKGNKLDEQPSEPTPRARSAKLTKKSTKDEGAPIKLSKSTDIRNADCAEKNVRKINKTVTPKMRREVFNRDKCCQYVNKETGEICGETAFAQTDHKIPLWAGGTNEMENLQMLCGNHNRLKYRKEAQLSWL